MVFLVILKNEAEPFKMKALECLRHFSIYKSMGCFSDAKGQITQQSVVESGRYSNRFEILWRHKSADKIFPFINLRELSFVMETRVLIRFDQKPNAAFPLQQ